MNKFIEKRLLIITTGGTIAGNVAKHEVSQEDSVSPRVDSFAAIINTAIDIIKSIWHVDIEPEIKDLYNIDSSDVNPAHWTQIVEAIEENYDEYDGFVVLHGTNTMGYTTAALSFALENINKPVIFTGAQVPLGYLGSDATTNLVNAIRLAVWGYHPLKGVLAVFGSKIISGTRVKKGTDFDYDPFKSFITGSIGQIGRVIRIDKGALDKYVASLSARYPLAIQSQMLHIKKDFDTGSIASLTEFPGMNPELFKSLVENDGIKGFILRSFGAGDPNSKLFPAFEYLKEKQIPIIVTTQAPNGSANFQVNEGGKYLKDNDLAIPAFDMSIEAMTVKLGWLLAQNLSYEQIKMKMVEDFHGEIYTETDLF
jgi:L-asparaginase